MSLRGSQVPYIAIVHIPDHTAAEWFIAEQQFTLNTRMVGLFEYPERKDLTCQGTCVVKHTGQWTRDRKGFMKCAICGKRNRKMRTWLINSLFDFLGANLYEKAPAVFRTPEGYGSFADND